MIDKFKVWHGNKSKYIDEIVVEQFEGIISGCFGGSSESGASKNEDGFFIAKPSENSTFAVLFDAHTTNNSVIYMIEKITEKFERIIDYCTEPVEMAIPKLQNYITELIQSKQVRVDCESLLGETAMLFCFQKDEYLWWLSVGDNSLYVFHKEFNELGQHRINQRVFYQWIGQKNSLSLKVPCFSSGTLQLREGENKLLLLTDGILEIDERPFEDNIKLEELFRDYDASEATNVILSEVKNKKGRDNATMITWSVNCNHEPLRPSRL